MLLSPLTMVRTLAGAPAAIRDGRRLAHALHGDDGGLTVTTWFEHGVVKRWSSEQPAQPKMPEGANGLRTTLTGIGDLSTRVDRRALRERVLLDAHAEHVRNALAPLHALEAVQRLVRGVFSALPLFLVVARAALRDPLAPFAWLLWPLASISASMALSLLVAVAVRLWLRRALRAIA